MFLISRLWIDTMENDNAYGFTPIGVVEEANHIHLHLGNEIHLDNSN